MNDWYLYTTFEYLNTKIKFKELVDFYNLEIKMEVK